MGGTSAIANLDGHLGGILDIAISRDGSRLLSCGYDCTIVVWDLTSRTAASTIKRYSGVVQSLDVSPDGRNMAASGQDKRGVIWHSEPWNAEKRAVEPPRPTQAADEF